mgnify:FL=1
MRRPLTSGRRNARQIVAVTWIAAALVVSACAETKLPAQLPGWLDLGQEKPPPQAEPAPPPKPKFVRKPEKPFRDPAEPREVKRLPKSDWEPEPVLPTAPELALEQPSFVELTPPVEEDGPIRVALLLPLSGREESLGRALLDAALIALFEIGDPRLTILPRDTGGTPEGARAAAEAVLQEGVQLILGPVFSAAVAAAAEPARERGVNVIAFSTDRLVAGNGVYLLGFMPDQQVDRVVEFAAKSGIWQFAALAPQTAYGEAVVGAMEQSVFRNGGQFDQVERYYPDDTEYFEPVQRLADYERRHNLLLIQREALEATDDPAAKIELQKLEGRDAAGPLDYQAVMLADGGARLRAIAPLLPFYDIDPAEIRFLGTGLWDEPTLGREPALVGGWFASPPPETAAAFSKRFESIHGYAPPRIASLAYDAAALASVLMQGEAGPDFSANALTQPSGFAGADGIFRFQNDGVAERGLAVIEVHPQGLRVIDQAPQAFTSGSPEDSS